MSAKFKVGQIWRAKRPANSRGLVNDRVIRWIGAFGDVQYDSPSVEDGRHYPKVSEEKFDKWAGRLLDPKELPADEWAPWNFADGSKNK